MPLEMKNACMRCSAPLQADGEAWICSFECTFCTGCTRSMEEKCPNCGGELLRRPRRIVPAARSAEPAS